MKTTTKKYDGYSEMAVELLKEADSDNHLESIPLYDKVINLFPEPAYAYARRGFSKHNIGDYSGAIADFNEAIDRKPKAANTIWQRGISKWRLEDYSGALSDFSLYIEIKPEDPEAYYWMGEIYQSNGDLKQAEACYKKSLALDDNYEDASDRLQELETKGSEQK